MCVTTLSAAGTTATVRLYVRTCLKGNIGTAWQNQVREFAGLPAHVVYTSNCLMPPSEELAGRIFTAGAVSYPGVAHIENGDFEPVIQMAKELGNICGIPRLLY